MWKQHTIILYNELREPRLDPENNSITVFDLPPKDMVSGVLLAKPDKRGYDKRVKIIEFIKKFNDDLELNQITCQLKFRV